MTRALIFGINGQDGSYLAEFLLSKGYEVIGWVPSTIPISYDNIQHILNRITLIQGDLSDQDSLNLNIEVYKPDEIYNYVSPSSPSASWNATVQTADITALGTARLLEAVRMIYPQARYYQASSSELFGNPVETPQKETTPFCPRNPYGIAKLYAHWLTVRYREKYGLYAVSGLLFNHESPRRGENFVTRKITRTLAAIVGGKQNTLYLGNLEARRDWGYAPDYVAAMWQMLQGNVPDDFVIGTGETHSVGQFLEEAFGYLKMDWHGYVKNDPRLYQVEDTFLQADSSKARRVLGWQPRVSFTDLVRVMVDADLERIGLKSPGEGAKIIEANYGDWHRWDTQVVGTEAHPRQG